LQSYLITDVGSTTTKAILIGQKDGEYRLIDRAESPTTVEEPFEDVNIGVKHAIEKLEKIVHELTSEDLTLEGSIKTYKEGMALVKHCNDSIEKIEKELEILTNRKA